MSRLGYKLQHTQLAVAEHSCWYNVYHTHTHDEETFSFSRSYILLTVHVSHRVSPLPQRIFAECYQGFLCCCSRRWLTLESVDSTSSLTSARLPLRGGGAGNSNRAASTALLYLGLIHPASHTCGRTCGVRRRRNLGPTRRRSTSTRPRSRAPSTRAPFTK